MSLRSLLAPLAVIGILFVIWYSEFVTTPPPQHGLVEITYWEKWTSFEGDAIRAVVDEFNRTQSHIHVNLLTISNIENKTLLAVAGGNVVARSARSHNVEAMATQLLYRFTPDSW